MRLFALAAVCLAASSASAFNPEEHKLAGDLGSQGAAAAITKLIPPSMLVKTVPGAGDVRVVVRDNIPNDSRFKGSFVPRERAHEARKPLTIWVGSADRKTGQYFSFGDLVSLYGDFRRIVTCDAQPSKSDCRLTDPPRPLPSGYDAKKWLDQRYTAMKELAQGWNYWDGWGLPVSTSKVSSVLQTNSGVIKGENTKGAWADEFYKIAKTNHWHFGDTALKWYVSMHRQAFLLMAQAAKAQDPKAKELLVWKALHYEGHALHSLTDLFAPGHVMVNRYQTSQEILAHNKETAAQFPTWQAKVAQTTFESFAPNGRPLPRPTTILAGAVGENDLKTLTHLDTTTFKSKYEAAFHDKFNASGAMVRNLKRGTRPPRFPSSRPRLTLPGEWRSFGDGKMFFYEGNKRLNPSQGEWVAAAVEDSLLSLVQGYQAVSKGGDPAKISMAPYLFDALGDIPIEMRNACVDKDRCFAPDAAKAGEYKFVSYAPAVFALLNLDNRLIKASLPTCTGASAKSGPSSSATKEGCEAKWDGATAKLENAKK